MATVSNVLLRGGPRGRCTWRLTILLCWNMLLDMLDCAILRALCVDRCLQGVSRACLCLPSFPARRPPPAAPRRPIRAYAVTTPTPCGVRVCPSDSPLQLQVSTGSSMTEISGAGASRPSSAVGTCTESMVSYPWILPTCPDAGVGRVRRSPSLSDRPLRYRTALILCNGRTEHQALRPVQTRSLARAASSSVLN